MQNKTNIICVIILTLFNSACGSSSNNHRTLNLESIRNQFAPLEEREIEPLDTVTLPPREQPDSATSFSARVIEGQIVPFNGLLLSDAAAAFIASEYEAIIQRCELSLSQQRARDMARLTRDVHRLQLQINIDRERFLLIFESQERHIALLNEELSRKNNVDIFQILGLIGSGALGVIIGTVVGFFAGL